MRMSSEERILSAAERHMRSGGYNGFSFRDIARDVGLTNAAVHHHFPTKAALATRLVEDYTQRFVEALDAAPPAARVRVLRELFARSLREDGKMCLCGLLAAECAGLPSEVAVAARRFFDMLAVRLNVGFMGREDPRGDALSVLAQLEGAALLATMHSDPTVFDTATRALPGV